MDNQHIHIASQSQGQPVLFLAALPSIYTGALHPPGINSAYTSMPRRGGIAPREKASESPQIGK
jgi:hypothetical protein